MIKQVIPCIIAIILTLALIGEGQMAFNLVIVLGILAFVAWMMSDL